MTAGKTSSNLLRLRWMNVLLRIRKTSLSDLFYVFIMNECARRYLAAFRFRCNRCLVMTAIPDRIDTAVCGSIPCTH